MKAFFSLCCLVAGILAGYLMENILIAGIIIGAILLLRDGIDVALGNPVLTIYKSKILTVWVFLMVAGLGVLDSALHPISHFIPEPERIYTIQGVVSKQRTLSTCEFYSLSIKKIDGKDEQGDMVLFAPGNCTYLPGDILQVKVKPKTDSINKFTNPRLTASLFNEKSITKIGERSNLSTYFARLRIRLDEWIMSTGLGDESMAIARALLLAEREGIKSVRLEDFRNGGSLHVLAVSGMHIGIITLILLGLTMPLSLVTGRVLRYLIVIIAVWIFVLLTGSALSTVRAALMLSIAFLARVIERHRDAFSCVCVATIFIILYWPGAIFDIGLQLSFASVGALCLFASPLNPIDHRSHPKTYRAYELILTTLIATAATWMLCGFHFGSVPLRFLPSNIIILPLLPFYVITILIYLGFHACGLEMVWLAEILEKSLTFIYDIISNIVSPGLSVNVGWITLLLWFLAFPALAIGMRLPEANFVNNFNQKEVRLRRNWIIISIGLALASLSLLPLGI